MNKMIESMKTLFVAMALFVGFGFLSNITQATHVSGLQQHELQFCQANANSYTDCTVTWDQPFTFWNGYTAVCELESFYGDQSQLHQSIRQKYADRMVVRVVNSDPVFTHSTRLNCIGME